MTDSRPSSTPPESPIAGDSQAADERDLEWVTHLLRIFKPDALERLVRAEQPYYSKHGEYLPGVARLALYYRAELARAAFVAEHLHAMIDTETWRATGGDDSQGHYEGDVHAERVAQEIETWKEIVG